MLLYFILFVVNPVTIRCSYDELHLPTYFFSHHFKKDLTVDVSMTGSSNQVSRGWGDLRMLRGQSRDHLAVLHIRLHCYFYLVCNQKHTVVLKINKHDWTAVFYTPESQYGMYGERKKNNPFKITHWTAQVMSNLHKTHTDNLKYNIAFSRKKVWITGSCKPCSLGFVTRFEWTQRYFCSICVLQKSLF